MVIQDSLDKRVQGLENGNVALTDLETGSNINLSRRNIALVSQIFECSSHPDSTK